MFTTLIYIDAYESLNNRKNGNYRKIRLYILRGIKQKKLENNKMKMIFFNVQTHHENDILKRRWLKYIILQKYKNNNNRKLVN